MNTYGKTKSIYNMCNTVFLGGSLINHGGQNPIEPARLSSWFIHTLGGAINASVAGIMLRAGCVQPDLGESARGLGWLLVLCVFKDALSGIESSN